MNEQQQAEMIRTIVQKVLEKTALCGGKDRDPASGAMAITLDAFPMQPFNGRQDVLLADLTTVEEAPRMGAGLMALRDHADFEWTLTYDEYDYVMDGTLEIVLDSGKVLVGNPGDVLYIPKDTHIHFRTPSHTKYVYFVYPADWQA